MTKSLSTVQTGERHLSCVNPHVFLQRKKTRESASTHRTAERFAVRMRIHLMPFKVGLTVESLAAVHAGKRPLASVLIQVTLECGGASKLLPTLMATEALHKLSLVTRVDASVQLKPVFTTESPPTEFTDVRCLTCVYSHVTHQAYVLAILHATQLTDVFFNRSLSAVFFNRCLTEVRRLGNGKFCFCFNIQRSFIWHLNIFYSIFQPLAKDHT